jgi:hypothetical protein
MRGSHFLILSEIEAVEAEFLDKFAATTSTEKFYTETFSEAGVELPAGGLDNLVRLSRLSTHADCRARSGASPTTAQLSLDASSQALDCC